MTIEIEPHDVRKLICAVTEAAAIWFSIPLSDMKVLVRRVSKTHCTSSIVPYRGHRSFSIFRAEIEKNDKLKEINAELSAAKSDFCALIISGPTFTRRFEFNDLIEMLIAEVQRRDAVPLNLRIDAVVSEFCDFLHSPRFSVSVFAPLSWAYADDGISVRVVLPSNTIIRQVTDNEIEEFFSRDILQTVGLPTFGMPELALEVTRPCAMSVGTSESLSMESFNQLQGMQDSIDWACSILHCYKPGAVTISRRYLKVDHWLPRHVMGGTSWQFPTASPIGPNYRFVAGDTEALAALTEKIERSPLRCIRIVADRLHLATQRTKPADSIVDVCIGFEALLGTSKGAPIAETLALRFAFLGAPADRQSRYKAMKRLYGYRSAIVHGSEPRATYDIGAGAIDLPTLKNEAMNMLRGLLQTVVQHPILSLYNSVPEEFWQNLILGTSDSAAGSPDMH